MRRTARRASNRRDFAARAATRCRGARRRRAGATRRARRRRARRSSSRARRSARRARADIRTTARTSAATPRTRRAAAGEHPYAGDDAGVSFSLFWSARDGSNETQAWELWDNSTRRLMPSSWATSATGDEYKPEARLTLVVDTSAIAAMEVGSGWCC